MDNIEKSLKFASSHEWVALKDDEAVIGISKHAEQLLGDLVFVELPEVGQRFEKGEEMAVVESVKAASDVYAPISGEVIAVNEALTDDPALINNAPFDTGWLVKLKPDAIEDIESLLSFEDYEAVVAEEA